MSLRSAALSLALTSTLAACAAGPSLPPSAAEAQRLQGAVDGPCSSGLCVSPQDLERMDAALMAVELCTPAAEESFDNDPSGISLAGLQLTEDVDGRPALRVWLANTAPQGVYTYPGTAISVVGGEGNVVGHDLLEDGGASWVLYGISPCDVSEHTYPLELVAGEPLKLSVRAFAELGELVLDDVIVVVASLGEATEAGSDL